MFLDTPYEAPFRLIVTVVIGIPFFVFIIMPMLSVVIAFAVMVLAIQVSIIASIVGYIVGIPWAIWQRYRYGDWPIDG